MTGGMGPSPLAPLICIMHFVDKAKLVDWHDSTSFYLYVDEMSNPSRFQHDASATEPEAIPELIRNCPWHYDT